MNELFFNLVKSHAGFAGSYIFLKDGPKVELMGIDNNNNVITSIGIIKFSNIEALVLEPLEFTKIKDVI